MPKGFIFKCTNKSESECFDRSLFGTDKLAGDEVLCLEPGDSLFLLNVESNRLAGVFLAETAGGHRLIPEAWKGRYPYQVKIECIDQPKWIENAKETLSALQLESHQPLDYYEVDALSTLLAPNGKQDQCSDREENATTLVKQIAEELAVWRRTNGTAHVRKDKPTLESTTLWDYPTQSYGQTPKGNNKYAGVTPAFIIWNLVKRYTERDDLVVDPMCGSGTTIDVCNEEGRRVKGYDIVPTRPDIIENDARSIPLDDNTVDMVFIDSPYGDNIKYNASPLSFGNISAESEEFYNELEKVMREAHRVLKEGKVLGWLIGDQWVKKRFTPVGFKIYERLTKYFEPVDVISVVRRGQSSNTGLWHNRARRFNFYLRGFKYLHIMRKPLEKSAQPERKRDVKWAYYERGSNKD
ncbi:MAG: DNA methyltransferase [Chloroflexota bacterium]